MAVPKFTYPVPAAKARTIKDTYAKATKPDGSPYARGKHGGIDVPPSTPGLVGNSVAAVQEGRVHEIGSSVWGPSYGKQVLLKHTHKHADGTRHYWYTFYAHLKSINVTKGQVVKAGALIGKLGESGDTFGSHVHFELHTKPTWRDGLMNPFARLEAARQA